MNFQYHTCVCNKHDDDELNITMENKTIWTSNNNDSLGTLLIGYFNYYSIRKNINGGISIFCVAKRGTQPSSKISCNRIENAFHCIIWQVLRWSCVAP